MIIDRIENIYLYRGLTNRIDYVINLLESRDFTSECPGKTLIEGDYLYYLVQEYQTKPECEAKLETHNRYIDIQFMLLGAEKMGYANKNTLTPTTDYNEITDIQFHEGVYSDLIVQEGCFALFFPEDAHKPGMEIDMTQKVKKIVFKIACD